MRANRFSFLISPSLVFGLSYFGLLTYQYLANNSRQSLLHLLQYVLIGYIVSVFAEILFIGYQVKKNRPYQHRLTLVLCCLSLFFPFTVPIITGYNYFSLFLWCCLLGISANYLFILFAARSNLANARLAIASTIVSILIVEYVLRILPIAPLTYAEKNFGGSYVFSHSERDTIYRNPLPQLASRRNTTLTYATSEFKCIFHYNNIGFRDRNWPDKPDTNKHYWVAFGDSYTEGAGTVPDSAWPRQLEKMVHSYDKSIQILNTGSSTYDPFMSSMVLEKLMLRYTPKVVMLCLNYSDIEDICRRGGRNRTDLQLYPSPYEYLYGLSFAFRYFWHGVLKRGFDGMTVDERKDAEKQAISHLHDEIVRLTKLGKQRGFDFYAILLPVAPEVLANKQPFGRLDTLPNVINLLPCYREAAVQSNLNRYYWPIDRHHTGSGYQLLAKCVDAELRKRGVLKLD
jgi:hypothetical protein